jgi:hypothetical protein
MEISALPQGTLDTLRDELESINGVRRAVLCGPPYEVVLICAPAEASVPIEAAARAVLSRSPLPAGEVRIEIGYSPVPEPRRRVRLVGAELQHPQIGSTVAAVALEWDGETQEKQVKGEGGSTAEIRLACRATLNALEALIDSKLTFDVVGVKSLWVFDSDLIVVLVRAAGAELQLTGVAPVVKGDRGRAAAAATLNATNRLLGNYLAIPD